MVKVSRDEVPDLPPNYSKSLNKVVKKLMTKDQQKRPSIIEVLGFIEIRKSCKILLETLPEVYEGFVSKDVRKKPILELSYEDDSEEEEKQMQMITRKFHLNKDMNDLMRSHKQIPIQSQSTQTL